MTEKKIIKTEAEKNKTKSTKLNKIKSKYSRFVKDISEENYLTDITYGRLKRMYLTSIRVMIASTRKFLSDDCFTKASSIAYTILLSLIPTLTVALTIYSAIGDKQAKLFKLIPQLLAEYNLQKLNVQPVIDVIKSLIANAAKIGGIGAVVMLFSATAVLRTLEKSLNNIWEIKHQRPIFIKIIYYWAALTLGPIMLFSGTTLATQISTIFTAPTYNSITSDSDKNIWLAGSKGTIAYKNKTNKKFTGLHYNFIDFDNQKVYKYNSKQKTFSQIDNPVSDIELKKINFTDIHFIKENAWAIGDNGVMLTSNNGGKSWNLKKFDSFNFNKIYMLSREKGYIIADDGYILKTFDGGLNWIVISLPGININLNSIDFKNNIGIIAADNGYILTLNQETNEWIPRQITEARIKKNFLNLNNINLYNENIYWITCDNGYILTSTNAGKNWEIRQFKQYDYFSSYIITSKKAYIAGEKGNLLYTEDQGNSWQSIRFPAQQINQLKLINNQLWAIGAYGMVMYQIEKNWHGEKGNNFFVYLLNFFAPFIFIWLFFLLIYKALPNIKIPFKPAAIGASLTGAIWVGFLLLFIAYVRLFANSTFAVYGAMAAIPIFLLIMYMSALIILFGAAVSYTLMYPDTYKRIRFNKKHKRVYNVFNSIKILSIIYGNFESGKGATNFKQLSKSTFVDINDLNYILDIFIKENIIIGKEGGEFLPLKLSKNIKIAHVIEIIHESGFSIPYTGKSDNVAINLKDIFIEIEKSTNKILLNKTLNSLISN